MVLDVDGNSVRVATSTNEVVIPRLLAVAGGRWTPPRLGSRPATASGTPRAYRPDLTQRGGYYSARGILAAAALAAAPLDFPRVRERGTLSGSRATAASPSLVPRRGQTRRLLTASLILYLARTTSRGL